MAGDLPRTQSMAGGLPHTPIAAEHPGLAVGRLLPNATPPCVLLRMASEMSWYFCTVVVLFLLFYSSEGLFLLFHFKNMLNELKTHIPITPSIKDQGSRSQGPPLHIWCVHLHSSVPSTQFIASNNCTCELHLFHKCKDHKTLFLSLTAFYFAPTTEG